MIVKQKKNCKETICQNFGKFSLHICRMYVGRNFMFPILSKLGRLVNTEVFFMNKRTGLTTCRHFGRIVWRSRNLVHRSFGMEKEFTIDMQVSGSYDSALYELAAVEEALAEWNLMYPDEYDDWVEVEEVHIDNINDWNK